MQCRGNGKTFCFFNKQRKEGAVKPLNRGIAEYTQYNSCVYFIKRESCNHDVNGIKHA